MGHRRRRPSPELIVLGQLHDHPLLRPAGVLDTAAYFKLAQRAAAGDWALGPAAYYVSPLYIYFLAFIFRVTGAVALHAQVAQVMLGAAAVALVAALETACRLDPSDPTAPYNLALLYARAGRLVDALRWAQRASSLDPASAHPRALLEELSRS